MKKLPILILFLISCTLSAQTVHFITPSDTDANINEPNNLHITYINQEEIAKNKLFLFLPGTGGVPFNYKLILKKAANLGYHALGLTYPNETAINSIQICAASIDTTCHRRARQEIFDGIDQHDAIEVNEANSIQNRLQKLIIHLSNLFPDENWQQYLSDGEVQWDKIIVSGHSQGGGHAGFISKIKKVDRVILFAAMDWIFLLNRTADWISAPGPTAPERYFGFIHDMDERIDYEKQVQVWADLGMINFGTPVLVDGNTPPFDDSHSLFTQITPAVIATQYHGSVVVDIYTPKDENDVPILDSVWEYLIDSPIVLGSEDSQVESAISIFPNPANHKLNIKLPTGSASIKPLKIFNNIGKLCLSKEIEGEIGSLDISKLISGIYFIQIKSGSKIYTQKFTVD